MKKILSLMLIAVFALTGMIAVSAASTDSPAVSAELTEVATDTVLPETFEVSGTVTELGEGYVIFTTADGQTIQANFDENTHQEFDLPGELSLGDFIHVTYDGKMTRSIPGQIYALSLRSHVRQGEIVSIGEESFLLKTDADEIQVNANADQLAAIAVGQTVKVYFPGMMTMSIPAQISADLIVVLSR